MSWAKLGTISHTASWEFVFRMQQFSTKTTNIVITPVSVDNPDNPAYSHTFSTPDETWTQTVAADDYYVYIDSPENLRYLDIPANKFTGRLYTEILINILYLYIRHNGAVTEYDLSPLTKLRYLKSQDTYSPEIDLSGKTDLINVDIFATNLSSSQVDSVALSVLSSAVQGDTSDGTFKIDYNNPPTSTGLTALYKLQALYGWTVTYDTSSAQVQINTLAELQAIGTDATTLGYDYIQMQDIDASPTSNPLYGTGETGDPIDNDLGNTSGAGNEGWLPIGDDTTRFKGTYDGKGYKIPSLKIVDTSLSTVGLFGRTDGASITQVKLTDIDITAVHYVGGIVGRAGSNDDIIEKCEVEGEISATSRAGLIVGMCRGIINDCLAEGGVEVSDIGGGLVVGTLSSGDAEINRCVGIGTCSDNAIAGELEFGTITNCYYNSDLATDANATGLTTGELRSADNYPALNFVTDWYMSETSAELRAFGEPSETMPVIYFAAIIPDEENRTIVLVDHKTGMYFCPPTGLETYGTDSHTLLDYDIQLMQVGNYYGLQLPDNLPVGDYEAIFLKAGVREFVGRITTTSNMQLDKNTGI